MARTIKQGFLVGNIQHKWLDGFIVTRTFDAFGRLGATAGRGGGGKQRGEQVERQRVERERDNNGGEQEREGEVVMCS